MNILIISSSVRPGRNTHRATLGIAKHLQNSSEVEAQVLDLMDHPLPLLEATFGSLESPSEELQALQAQLEWADAMIFVSPEYNGTFSSALKNFVDTFAKGPFMDKPIGVCSVSTGPGGGIRGALQMQSLVLAIFAFPIPQMMLVPRVKQVFDEEGNLLDEGFQTKIDSFSQKLIWFTKRMLREEKVSA
ncbi:MAG: NAD(P)H-dependent oxidoreductase [Bacteroidota bacterium]